MEETRFQRLMKGIKDLFTPAKRCPVCKAKLILKETTDVHSMRLPGLFIREYTYECEKCARTFTERSGK